MKNRSRTDVIEINYILLYDGDHAVRFYSSYANSKVNLLNILQFKTTSFIVVNGILSFAALHYSNQLILSVS